MKKSIDLPCGCDVEIDTEMFPSGERGVACQRHERSFVIAAVMPKEPVHKVTRERRYTKLEEEGTE